MPSGWLPNAVALARRGEAIHDHQGLRSMAEDSLRSTTFEDLQVPFQCVATDMAGVREVWFSSGPLVVALLASAALPAVYPAVEIDGVRYLDGGIVDDVPVSRAVELGATRIYVLQVGSFTRPRPEPRRPLDVAVQSYWIARHYRFKRDLLAMPPGVEVHVLPAGDRPKMRYNDFTHTGTLIDVAYAASSAYLADRAAGVPVPSVEEALSQVESSYPADDADELEGAAITSDPADSRWRRTVAAAMPAARRAASGVSGPRATRRPPRPAPGPIRRPSPASPATPRRRPRTVPAARGAGEACRRPGAATRNQPRAPSTAGWPSPTARAASIRPPSTPPAGGGRWASPAATATCPAPTATPSPATRPPPAPWPARRAWAPPRPWAPGWPRS